MHCYRFQDILGSESIVAPMAERADYSHPDLEVQGRIYHTEALLNAERSDL